MKNVITLLLFIVLFTLNSFAQPSPGGTPSNLTLWLDAKDGVETGGTSATDGGSIDSWINQQINPGCIDLNQTTSSKMPTYRTNALNFNPIVEFDGSGDQLDRSVLGSDIFAASNNTIFFVHKYYSGIVYFKWEQGSSGNRVGFENSGGSTRFDFPTDAIGNQTIGTFPFNTAGQIVTSTSNSSTSTLRNMGLQNTSNPTTGTLNTSFTSNLSIGENVSFSVPSQVDFAEIIIYNEALSAIDQNKVESYLAIKYGMTLGINGTSLNYNSSGGNSIWDPALNTGYNFDIAGISRDDLTNQDQRKSKSINQLIGIDSDILTMSNGTNFTTPIAFGTDMSHLIWGHNNAALILNDTISLPTVNAGVLNTLLDRHWKSQETGAAGTTTLHFELTNVSGFNTWSNLKLIVDTDSNFTNGATSISPSMIDSTGTLTIEFEHDFSNTDGFYFTIATTTPLSIDNPSNVSLCDSFTLSLPITGIALVNPQYYSDTSGTGTVIPLGTIFTTDTVIYLFDETGSNPNQFDEDTLTITITPTPTIIAGISQSICIGDQVTLTGSGATPLIWDNGITDGVGFAPTTTQLYTVTGNTNGCIGQDTVTVFVNLLPTVGAESPQTVCEGTQVILNGSGAINYSWDNGITNGNPFTPTSSNTYTVIGTDANNCSSTDQTIITVNSNPITEIIPSTFSGNPPLSISFDNGSTINNNYTWNFGNGDTSSLFLPPNITYENTGTYIVALIVSDPTTGCLSSDQVIIEVIGELSIIIPTIFTPNDDGINDVFNAVLENSESYSMEIFNRWGSSIFETNSVEIGWDGKKNGSKVAEGTYYYIIKYSFSKQGVSTSNTVKGAISLLN
tara:strand:+ start:8846 stop:11380 length:2535 start_codon:yes stop_codon:yes gene_type:complete